MTAQVVTCPAITQASRCRVQSWLMMLGAAVCLLTDTKAPGFQVHRQHNRIERVWTQQLDSEAVFCAIDSKYVYTVCPWPAEMSIRSVTGELVYRKIFPDVSLGISVCPSGAMLLEESRVNPLTLFEPRTVSGKSTWGWRIPRIALAEEPVAMMSVGKTVWLQMPHGVAALREEKVTIAMQNEVVTAIYAATEDLALTVTTDGRIHYYSHDVQSNAIKRFRTLASPGPAVTALRASGSDDEMMILESSGRICKVHPEDGGRTLVMELTGAGEISCASVRAEQPGIVIGTDNGHVIVLSSDWKNIDCTYTLWDGEVDSVARNGDYLVASGGNGELALMRIVRADLSGNPGPP